MCLFSTYCVHEYTAMICLNSFTHSVKIIHNIIIIIINEKISVAFSPKTARTRNTQNKDDMFSRQRKKQEGQQPI